MTERRNVLVIGATVEEYARFAPFLARDSFRTDHFPGAERAIEFVQEVPFDLLVVRFPMRNADLGRFLGAVRAASSASRSAPLVLLAEGKDAGPAEAFLERGANRVLRFEQGETEVQSVIAGVLDVAPRRAARLPVRLEVRLDHDRDVALGYTINVSRSGMLVETTDRPAAGQHLAFSFMAGQGPVSGTAEVARHARAEREQVDGVGLRFASFSGNSRSRYDRFLGSFDAPTPSFALPLVR